MEENRKKWYEFKKIFDRMVLKRYEFVKNECRKNYVIKDKGIYFVVLYKDIEVLIMNEEGKAILCEMVI